MGVSNGSTSRYYSRKNQCFHVDTSVNIIIWFKLALPTPAVHATSASWDSCIQLDEIIRRICVATCIPARPLESQAPLLYSYNKSLNSLKKLINGKQGSGQLAVHNNCDIQVTMLCVCIFMCVCMHYHWVCAVGKHLINTISRQSEVQ